LTANPVILPRPARFIRRRIVISRLADGEEHVMRSHLEGIELQCECRERQFQMVQFFGARVPSVFHGMSCTRFAASVVDRACRRDS